MDDAERLTHHRFQVIEMVMVVSRNRGTYYRKSQVAITREQRYMSEKLPTPVIGLPAAWAYDGLKSHRSRERPRHYIMPLPSVFMTLKALELTGARALISTRSNTHKQGGAVFGLS